MKWNQPWYQLYASAVVELDAKQLIERVDATEAAIHGRLRDLQSDSDHHEERQRMEDAHPSVFASLRLNDEGAKDSGTKKSDAEYGHMKITDVKMVSDSCQK